MKTSITVEPAGATAKLRFDMNPTILEGKPAIIFEETSTNPVLSDQYGHGGNVVVSMAGYKSQDIRANIRDEVLIGEDGRPIHVVLEKDGGSPGPTPIPPTPTPGFPDWQDWSPEASEKRKKHFHSLVDPFGPLSSAEVIIKLEPEFNKVGAWSQRHGDGTIRPGRIFYSQVGQTPPSNPKQFDQWYATHTDVIEKSRGVDVIDGNPGEKPWVWVVR